MLAGRRPLPVLLLERYLPHQAQDHAENGQQTRTALSVPRVCLQAAILRSNGGPELHQVLLAERNDQVMPHE
jgi:hypothetical protein